MRKADPSKGFLMCFLSNMALHFWWGIAALVLLILHFWLDFSLLFCWAACVIWGVEALILTAIVYWANHSSQTRDPVKPNKNPYSAKQEEVFPGFGSEPTSAESDHTAE